MSKQRNFLLPGKYTKPALVDRRTYHKPLLIEWGNLQDITRGGSGTQHDSYSDAASNIHARPQPRNYYTYP